MADFNFSTGTIALAIREEILAFYGPNYAGSRVSYSILNAYTDFQAPPNGTYNWSITFQFDNVSGTLFIGDITPPTISLSTNTFTFNVSQYPSGLTDSFLKTHIGQFITASDNSGTVIIEYNPTNLAITTVPSLGVTDTYNYQVRAKDPSGNTSSYINFQVRYVNDLPQPITITKIGDLSINTVTYPVGVTFTQLQNLLIARFNVTSGGQSYSWEFSPTITIWEAPTSGSVTRTYQARVFDNYYQTYTSYVTILATYSFVDTIAPTITGPNAISLVEDVYFDEDVLAYFTFTDNVTPTNLLDNYITGTRDYNVAGVYNIVINSKDQANNIGTKNVTLTITSSTVVDTQPPVASGPTSFTFILNQNKRLSDVRLAYTVFDNFTPVNEIGYEGKINGSTIQPTYQFPLGITNLTLRFFDSSNNYTQPILITVNVLANDVGLIYNDDSVKLAELIALQEYSGTMVQLLSNNVWTPISWVLDPVTVNYTIDQTTDEININFISNNLDNRLEAGQLVRVIYASPSDVRETWGIPEYDNQDRPTNHDIMVVDSGNMVKVGSETLYRHNYKLAELITILKDYRIPTLSYTSFTSSTVINAATGLPITYYAQPYNALSIIQRAIKQAFPVTVGDTNPLTTEIQIMGQDFLANEMIGVDHQFEEATLYDAITEIARIIGKTPVLYLNPEYSLTNSAKYLLFFETDREHTIGTQTKANLIANSTEFVESTVSDKDKGQVVVDAHNVIGASATKYPSDDLFTYASALDQELTTVGTGKQMVIVLPNNISAGEKVFYRTFQVGMTTAVVGGVRIETGAIQFATYGTLESLPLIKYNEWLVLDFLQRQKTAYYKENENIVYLPVDNDNVFTSDSYKKSPNDSLNRNVYDYVLYQVEYFPIMDFESKIGDGKQTTFNQINSMVDSETLGVQVANYLKGNEGGDIVVSKIETDYQQILKPTQLVSWDNETYHITSVSFNTIKLRLDNKMITGYKVAYQLNKDIRRNTNLNAPANQREYQIPYDNVYNRYDVIKEKVKIHFTTNTKASNAPIISEFKYLQDIGATDYRYILGSFETTNTYPTIETAMFATQSVVFTNSGLTSTTIQNRYIATPVSKTIFGNSILINIKLPNNAYAGTKIVPTDNTDNERFQQRQVSYVDSFGKAQTISIKYLWQNIDTATDVVDLTRFFPETTESRFNSVANIMAQISTWEIDKDSRETLNATLQIDFEGVNGTKIGTNFLKGSSIYKERQWTTNPYRIVKLVNKNYEPNDIVSNNDITGTIIPIDAISPIYSQGLQILLDDDYTFDTTSTYALIEQVGTVGINFIYKIVAIMGDRSSLVVTDTVFIYY